MSVAELCSEIDYLFMSYIYFFFIDFQVLLIIEICIIDYMYAKSDAKIQQKFDISKFI